MSEYEQILQRVVSARKMAGLSQSQLGRELGLGTSGWSDIENGRNPLTVERMLKVCDICGVDRVWLLTGVNPAFDVQEFMQQAGTINDDILKLAELFQMITKG